MKLFTNWTDEDFSYTWNKEPYNFKANTSIELEDGLAEHFAYHLSERELLKSNKPTDDPSKELLMNKCYGKIEVPVVKEPTVEVNADDIEPTNEEPEVVAKAPVKRTRTAKF